MDQQESIVQPVNQWGNKEGRKVISQRTTIQRISIYRMFYRLESGKDDISSEAHLRSSKLGEVLIKTQNYTFLSKYWNPVPLKLNPHPSYSCRMVSCALPPKKPCGPYLRCQPYKKRKPLFAASLKSFESKSSLFLRLTAHGNWPRNIKK